MGAFPQERCMRQMGETLARLVAIDGVAGFEDPVTSAVSEMLDDWPDVVERDALGNLLALRRGDGGGPSLMLAAHMDEIGMAVSHIEPEGYLRFEKVGGVVDAILPGRPVRVKGRPGVIGIMPGHYRDSQQASTVTPHHQLHIDVGVDSRDDAERLGIAIGDPVAFDSPLMTLAGGHRVAGKAVDNRLGCAVLLQMIQELGEHRPAGDLWLVFTVQEEVGLRGAMTSAYGIDPDYALAIDTIPCGGTPDVPTSRAPTRIGAGPVLPFISQSGGKGMFMHPTIKEMLLEVAQAEDIPYQPYLFYAGNNDASSIHLVRAGVPAGSVCLPRRYSHSQVEMADLRDAVAATRLLTGMVMRMKDHGAALRAWRQGSSGR